MYRGKIRGLFFGYLVGGFCFLLGLYILLSFVLYTTEHETKFSKEGSRLERIFYELLSNYQAILENVSKEIGENNIFSNPAKIADCLQKTYAYGIENKSGERIRALGINWVGVGETHPIGRLGQVEHPLEFDSDYIKRLEKNPEKLEVSSFNLNAKQSMLQFVNLGMGVKDKKGTYQGFINARVDLNSLIERLKQSKELEDGIQVIFMDNASRVLFSSLNLTPEDVNTLKGGNAEYKGYLFPRIQKLNDYPYFLLLGYSKSQYYAQFLEQSLPHIFTFFLFFIIVTVAFYIYHRRILKKNLSLFSYLSEQDALLINSLSQKILKLDKEKTTLEHFIKCAEDSEREEKRFHSEINKRISNSLSSMINLGRLLLEKIKEGNGLEQNPKEIMGAFEQAYIHSRFLCIKNETENISIREVLDEVVVLISKEVHKKNITFKIQISKNIKSLSTDRTSLKQVLASLLFRSIKNSPKESNIELKVYTQKDQVFLECRDSGYGGEFPFKNQGPQEDVIGSFNCMFLEWKDLEKVVRSLGGTISTYYKPHRGNNYLLSLPYKTGKNRFSNVKNKESLGDNVIEFVNLRNNKVS